MSRSRILFFMSAATVFLVLSGLLYHAVPPERAHFDRDSVGYHRIAEHFVQTGRLADPGVRGGVPIQPIGYPLLMGLFYWAFGSDVRPIIFFQILLTLLCIGLIFVIARRLFGDGVARIALLLSTINLGLLVYAQFLLAETVMVAFLLLFFERLTAFLRSQASLDLVCAGLLLGVSVLIKPMALLFIFLLVPFLLFFACNRSSMRKRIFHLLFLACGFYAPFLGYMGYNYLQWGHFRYAPMTSLNIYQCYLSKVIAAVHNLPVEPVRTGTLAFTGAHGFDEAGWDTGRALFSVYAKDHLWVFVRVWITNVAKTIFGLYATQLKLLLNPQVMGGSHSFFKISGNFCQRCMQYVIGQSPNSVVASIAIAELIWNFLCWLLVLFAYVLLIRAKNWCIFYLFLSYSLQSVLVTGIDGCCRYRVTIEPILIMLAAVGIYALYTAWYKKEIYLPKP